MRTLIHRLLSFADLATAPIEVILLAKVSILLALAWLAHGLLATSNPRARVLLWRATLIGLAALPVLACMPPMLSWPVANIEPAEVTIPSSAPTTIAQIPSPAVKDSTPRRDVISRDAQAPDRAGRSHTNPPSPAQALEVEQTPAAQSLPPSVSVSIGAWLWIAWTSGVLILTARFALSHRMLTRLVRRSRIAPEHVLHACRLVAERLGCTKAPRVVVSAQIASPCLAGILQPTVILPEHECGDQHVDLEAILAHELAHLRGRDLIWNLATHSASILLWFHPLAWRIRAAHAGACEAVCDAVAADLLNDVPAYARTLARLALQVTAAPPTAGLAMARVSTVRRRILALENRLFRAPLRRVQIAPALCLGTMLLAVIGSSGLVGREAVASLVEPLPAISDEPVPTKKLTGHVVLPDGTRVAGVELGIGTQKTPLILEAGRLPRTGKFARTITAVDGSFSIDSPSQQFILIASGEQGFGSIVFAPLATTPKDGKILIQPWGKITGQATLGGKPVADHAIEFLPGSAFWHRAGSIGALFTDAGYKTETDKQGRFTFERVPPIKGVACIPIVTDLGEGRTQRLRCWPLSFPVSSGVTTTIELGATGRTVVGKVVLDGTSDLKIDWTKNAPIEITLQPDPSEQQIIPPLKSGPFAGAQYAAKLDSDGRFQIEDVPLGRFRLHFSVTRPFDPNVRSEFSEIGRATLTFGLPEPISGREKEPFDLGSIKAVLDPTPSPDARMPRLTLLLLDGKPFPAAATRGKVTLVAFWSPGFAPSLADMQTWKDIRKAFGDNARFAMVGVACDATSDEAEKAVEKHGLSWPQLLGGRSGFAAVGYSNREVPTVLLLAPDGKVLAKKAKGAELVESVRKALSDEKLFASPNVSWQEVFPVKHIDLEAISPTTSKNEKPALMVVEHPVGEFARTRIHSSDGTTRTIRPVPLRFLTDKGAELRSIPGADGGLIGVHSFAIDAARERAYLADGITSNHITAVDLWGRKLWQIEKQISMRACCIDPKTGNLWGTFSNAGAPPREYGLTWVFDNNGTQIATLPIGGSDIAYDPQGDVFWIVNFAIVKLSREGKTLLRISTTSEKGVFRSVSVNPRDGSVWAGQENVPGTGNGETEIWHVDARGHILAVSKRPGLVGASLICDSQNGNVWITGLGQANILRMAPDGQELAPIPIKATSLSISPTTGRIWAATKTEILELDRDGKTLERFPFKSAASYAWVGAF